MLPHFPDFPWSLRGTFFPYTFMQAAFPAANIGQRFCPAFYVTTPLKRVSLGTSVYQNQWVLLPFMSVSSEALVCYSWGCVYTRGINSSKKSKEIYFWFLSTNVASIEMFVHLWRGIRPRWLNGYVTVPKSIAAIFPRPNLYAYETHHCLS